MVDTQTVLQSMQMLLSFGNICIIGYGFYKFINKPHDTLEERHNELEKRVDEQERILGGRESLKKKLDAQDALLNEHSVKLKEHEESLHHGNDKFRRQADINEVFINCMLAFIDFEMAYCAHTGYEDIADLTNAKNTLRKYLAKG